MAFPPFLRPFHAVLCPWTRLCRGGGQTGCAPLKPSQGVGTPLTRKRLMSQWGMPMPEYRMLLSPPFPVLYFFQVSGAGRSMCWSI